MSARWQLSDFDLVRTLGTGSFGRVFLSRLRNSPHPDPEPFAIKRLKKAVIIRQRQVDHIMSEKAILESLNHPFVVRMYGTFHDSRYIYFVLEYVVGGEFFSYLRKTVRFPNDSARFYAAQITSIFEYLHNQNIIYRDLKPENLLLDVEGYLKLTDFGFAKVIDFRTYTLCGTPEYIAPEVLLNRGHGKPVDWWTLGILIFEMIVGYPPFMDEETMGVYQKILAGRIVFPRHFDRNAKSLVKKLLTADLARRYGNLRGGASDVKNHRWFEGLSFDDLLERRLAAPYKPQVSSKDDTSHFDEYPDSDDQPFPVSQSSDPFAAW